MSAVEPLCCLLGIDPRKFTKEENVLLEIELFARLCEELKEIFREQHRDYFCLMKFTKREEDEMLENRYICLIIEDIISTKEYNSQGIAHYADTYEDVIEEVRAGRKVPSVLLFRKLKH